MATYDLRSEPWISVVTMDGSQREVGLRQVLCEAHEIREIRDPFPTVEFGLYRLLVALVTDIFHPANLRELGDLLAMRACDAAQVDAYLTRWGDRFDLFHPQYPFLQTAGMEGETEKPLSGFVAAVPSGTNALHFHHAMEKAFGVCPAVAARLLTTLAPFMTAGGAGLSPSINGAPPWYVLIRGRSLFETLCLNCCVLPLATAAGTTPPAWRNDTPVQSDSRYQQASLLEGLTWRPRRIHLVPGSSGCCRITGCETPFLVRTMQFSAGAACDFAWTDPSVSYRIAEKITPLRPQEDRALWRDTGPFVLLREGDYVSEKGKMRFERPVIVTQYAQLIHERILPQTAQIAVCVYGMRTDMKMKIFEWQRDTLAVPAGVMRSGAHGGAAQVAMERADTVAYYLKQAIKHAYPRDGKSNSAAFDARVTAAQQDFWERLRTAYDAVLQALSQLPDDETSREEALATSRDAWAQTVQHAGAAALEEAIHDLDTNAGAMQRLVEARQRFRTHAWGLFHPESARGATGRGRVAAIPTIDKGGDIA